MQFCDWLLVTSACCLLSIGTELVPPLSKDCFCYIIFLWLNNSSVNVKCPKEHKQDSLCKLDWTESYWKPFITNKPMQRSTVTDNYRHSTKYRNTVS